MEQILEPKSWIAASENILGPYITLGTILSFSVSFLCKACYITLKTQSDKTFGLGKNVKEHIIVIYQPVFSEPLLYAQYIR